MPAGSPPTPGTGIVDKYKVTVWYTAPTALRMLMKAGDDVIKQYNMKSLRFITSVGEPLNPEVIRWGMKVYDLPIHENYWMTETGCNVIANFYGLPLKVGAMGKPFPGIRPPSSTTRAIYCRRGCLATW